MFSLPTMDVLHACELTADDARLWAGFVAARPELQGPYFDIRYVQTIGSSVPRAGVVRFRDGGRVAGYFPYQMRSGVLQPMGAPMSDYHGVIAEAGFVPDFDAVLKATGAKRLEFQGWVGAMSDRASGLKLTRRLADASQGYGHWFTSQDAQYHKFFKNVGRCQRNVDKDFGGFDFSWERVTPELLDWTLDLKQQQYKSTGMHDVFACGWTRDVLEDLAKLDAEDYGLRAGVFRHDGHIVASEISLMGAEDVHLWFPAYDAAYARYSVGILLTIAIIRHLAPQGIKRFDFGTGGEDYKSPLTSAGGACFEGELTFSPQPLSSMLDRLTKPDVRLSMKRRIKVIRATETSLGGWGRAMRSLAGRALSRLHNRLTLKPA